MRFTALDEGPVDAETVVLLHGFPQSAQSWIGVSRPLLAAGYRVIAPDQRSHTRHARPRSRWAYRLNELVEDVVALVDAAGVDRVHLVGHDPGGGVAWMVAATRPDRLHTLTVVSSPHPRAVVGAMLTSRQLLQAWHVGFFQLPWLPKAAVRSRGGRFAVALVKHSDLGDDLARAYADRAHQRPWRPCRRGALVPRHAAGHLDRRQGRRDHRPDDVCLEHGRCRHRSPCRAADQPVGDGPVRLHGARRRFTLDPRTGAGQTGRVHPGTDQERVVGDQTGASPRSTSSVWARRSILHAIRRCASSRWSVRGLTIGGS